jgi:amphi-Trp domain-containing protein
MRPSAAVVMTTLRRRRTRAKVGRTATKEPDVDLIELKEKTTLRREEAAARLREIADELASGNDIVWQQDNMRIVAKVPDEVHLKVEFEIDDDGSELELELTW